MALAAGVIAVAGLGVGTAVRCRARACSLAGRTSLAGLERGQTLTQIARRTVLSRDVFLSELVSQAEKDIKDGQRFGIPASANLNFQLASVIDEPGLVSGASLCRICSNGRRVKPKKEG